MRSLIDCWKQHTMSAHLPHPSPSAGAMTGFTVISCKIGIATQRQREQAMMLAQLDKSHEPAMEKTPAVKRVAGGEHHVVGGGGGCGKNGGGY